MKSSLLEYIAERVDQSFIASQAVLTSDRPSRLSVLRDRGRGRVVQADKGTPSRMCI